MIEELMGSRWGGYMVMAVLLGGVARCCAFCMVRMVFCVIPGGMRKIDASERKKKLNDRLERSAFNLTCSIRLPGHFPFAGAPSCF